jgi:uncharacterized protein (TIRG00374 family)
MKKFRARDIWFVALIGVAIFAIFITRIGYVRFLFLISNVNKSFVIIVFLLNVLNIITFTMSWKFLILTDIGFYKLFKFYVAGIFINNITPTLGSGGEPVKAMLLGKETGSSKAECFAGVVYHRLVNIFSFLAIELAGIGLLFYRPGLTLERWEISALVLSIVFGFSIFGLLIYFYIRKDKLSSFALSMLRSFAPLIRRVKKSFDYRTHAGAIEQSINSFFIGFRGIHCNKNGLAKALLFSSLGWVFEIMEMYVIFLSLGPGAHIPISVLIITYSISIISGWIPLFLPGGIGVVDSTMATLFVLGGVPLEVALLAALLYRLASYWFNTVLGAFYLWNSLKRSIS